MRTEGKGLVAERTPEDSGDLSVLTRLMKLSSELADCAMVLYGTEEAAQGMKVMEIADKLADVVGGLAARNGYTMDEVTASLWKGTTVNTPQ
jgi:hypothetical protein